VGVKGKNRTKRGGLADKKDVTGGGGEWFVQIKFGKRSIWSADKGA